MSINMAYTYPKELEKAKKEKWPILIPVGTDDWFAQDAIEMSIESGRKNVELSVEGHLKTIQGEK